MKSNIWGLLLCGAMILSLASCGEQDAAGRNKVSDTTTVPTEDAAQEDNGLVTGDNAEETDVMGDSAVKNSTSADKNVSSATDANVSKSRNGLTSSSWERMLRNGHIRDTDGDLTDGENSYR